MPDIKDNKLKMNDNQVSEIDEYFSESGTAFEVISSADFIAPDTIKLESEQPVNKIIKSGPEFNREKAHLINTAEAIRNQIKQLERSIGYTGKYAVVKGGDDGTEEIQLRHAKEMSREHTARLNHMYDLSLKPYEFKVDIVENGTLTTYYLGPETISRLGTYTVYSYHDNRYGKYLNSTSREILSAVELRRQFSISRSQLKNYKNTYIHSDGAETITNPYLLQILQERRKDHTVRNIVASIQEEQDKIVQAPASASMIIQGCAGSGKTMIMMQRLSRLQNYLKYVNAYDVVIITPSNQYKLFMKALTEGLAIQRMLQSTIEQYYNWILSLYNRDFTLQIDKVRRDSDGTVLYASYIYSNQFRERLCSDLPDEFIRTREVFNQLVLICRDFSIPVLVSPDNSTDERLWTDLQALLKVVQERADDHRKDDDFFDDVQRNNVDWKNSLTARVDELQEKINNVSPFNIYKRFLQKAVEPVLEELNITIPNRYYKYDLYARLVFCKEYYGINLDLHSFICVDEGQDLSLNEYRLLQELCGKRAVFNVYGDIHQNINPNLGIHSWFNLSKELKARQYTLEENYRNTSQIIRRCRAEFKLNIRTMGLEGPDIRFTSLEQLAKVELKHKAGKKERWAVIIPRSMSKRKVFNELVKEVPNGILSLNRISEESVVLVNVEDIKGFEFEKVYCLYEEMEDNERYVAYTRALQELVLVKVPNNAKYRISDRKDSSNRKENNADVNDTALAEELGKLLEIDFPKEKLIPLLYHASYQPQSNDVRKINKEYAFWGKQIIEMVYAMFLYRQNPNIGASELSKRLQKASTSVEEAIYRKYNLEKFVKKSAGQEGQVHKEIAIKITALIFSCFGYGRVYDFLVPFFDNVESYVDYKSMVQEYAQTLKTVASYIIVDETGPEHQKMFTCRLYVGNLYSEAVGSGKKNAEKAAAKVFSEKYMINPSKRKGDSAVKSTKRLTLSKKRRVELAEAARVLGINLKYINTDDLEKALTHKSYTNENKQCTYNNETLSILGAEIIGSFFGNYYYAHSGNDKEMTLILETSNIADEKNLVKVLPDQILKYLNAAKGIKDGKVETAFTRLKVAALKSVIAVLWIGCYESNKADAIKYVGSYIYNIFEKESLFIEYDYRSLLLDIIQKHKFKIEESFEQVKGTSEDMPTFLSTYLIRNEGWRIEASGYGNSKKAANNRASKSALSKLLPYITEDVANSDRIRKYLA